jgi:hypothetical protein
MTVAHHLLSPGADPDQFYSDYGLSTDFDLKKELILIRMQGI